MKNNNIPGNILFQLAGKHKNIHIYVFSKHQSGAAHTLLMLSM